MKKQLSILFFVCVTAVISAGQEQQRSEPQLPTNEEIKLVVEQSETAFALYKQSVEREAELPSMKQDKTALEKDQNIVKLAQQITDGLKRNPGVFNGVGGLFLLTTLDDASRNAALCSGSGESDAVGAVVKEGKDSAYRIMAIAQNCISISAHLYAVSESVNALYVRYVEAQANLNGEATATINQCATALQKATGKK
jgi:hypothetical protein